MKFRPDTDAIIFNKEYGLAEFLTLLTDLYKWIGLIAHIFGSIIDQVLQYLGENAGVAE